MTVQIPREYTDLFKDFFTNFDEDLDVLDIQSYGMSVTTLEQVFLEIGHDPDPKPKFNIRQPNDDEDSFDRQESPDKAALHSLMPSITPGLGRNSGRDNHDTIDDPINDSSRGLLSNNKVDSAFVPSSLPSIEKPANNHKQYQHVDIVQDSLQ